MWQNTVPAKYEEIEDTKPELTILVGLLPWNY
jgi:hypothetical protein